jgi:hypothetical protein
LPKEDAIHKMRYICDTELFQKHVDMKTIVLSISIILLCFFSNRHSHAQNIKDVGAGVIEMLMGSQKISSDMKPGERIALNVVRDVLVQASRREHEMGVASAGKTEINLRDNVGNQAQLVKDENGNVYLIQNGQLYPIDQQIVNQARNSRLTFNNRENQVLQPASHESIILYGTKEYQPYNLSQSEALKEKISVKEFFDRFGINKDEIFVRHYLDEKYEKPTTNVPVKIATVPLKNYMGKFYSKLYLGNGFIRGGVDNKFRWTPRTSGVGPAMKLSFFDHKLLPNINSVFTYNWAEDFDKNIWLSIDEFQGIKRSFEESEQFIIGANITSSPKSTVHIEVYDEITGSLFFSDLSLLTGLGEDVLYYQVPFEFTGNFFIPGTFVYVVSLKSRNGKIISTAKDKFQIQPEEKVESDQTSLSLKKQDNTEISSIDVNSILFNLISGKIISQSDYIVLNAAIGGDNTAKEKASEILFNLVSDSKISSKTFSLISKAITK